MGLLLNSPTRVPQALQQAWQNAQACWQKPFAHGNAPQLVLASRAFFTYPLWSRFTPSTIHIYWGDFENNGEQSALRPYLSVALALEMGYFYWAPGNATLAADLQLQARQQLNAHALSTADALVQHFLTLLVLDKLHHKGLATSGFLQIQQQSPDTRLPAWIARLYEYLWRLPTGDLTHAYAQAPALREIEETCACLAQQIFHRQRHGHTLRYHRRSQLKSFLNYAVHHLQTPVETPAPLLMVLPQPIGLRIQAAGDPPHAPESAPEKETATPEILTPQGAVRGCISPRQILKQLPEHQASALLARYYREAAWPYLYTLNPPSPLAEDIYEGIETWSLDHPIQQLNWQASLSESPTLIPGITTRQQIHSIYPCPETTTRHSSQLTLYLDTSQSMPHPHQEQSLVVLTGFVLMLSALQIQWPVRIINWSEGESDTGYTLNEKRLTQALLQEPHGSTHFPLETLLQEARSSQNPGEVRVLLSDLGTVKSLQQRATLQPSAMAELNKISTQCLLYLPLPQIYQQQSLQQLQTLLPRWRFKALSHPQTMPRLWGPGHD